jgi:hypothetical protein
MNINDKHNDSFQFLLETLELLVKNGIFTAEEAADKKNELIEIK